MGYLPKSYGLYFEMILLIILVLSVFRFAGNKRKMTLIGVLSTAIILFADGLLLILSLQIVPTVKYIVVSVLSFLFLLDLTFEKFVPGGTLRWIAATAVSLVLPLLLFFSMRLWGVSVLSSEGKYVGVYSGVTGFGETWVDYYEYKMPFFMDLKCSYAENYGVVLGNADAIRNSAPYITEYFD